MVNIFEKKMARWEQDHAIADALFYLVWSHSNTTFAGKDDDDDNKQTPMLDVFARYCAGYGPALICLNERAEASDKFAAFLDMQAAGGMYAKLPDYLILPVQRVPRYRMLLESLLANTWPRDPECAVIRKALDSVAAVADRINEAIREHQELEQLIRVSKQIKNAPVRLVVPRRAFLRDGMLVKICRKSPKPRHFFLFTDCMVYTKRIEAVGTVDVFHRMIMLAGARVLDVSDRAPAGASHAFQILAREKSFTLCARDAAEKRAWLDAIGAAVDKLCLGSPSTAAAANSSSSSSPGRGAGGGQAPVWVPDSESEDCMRCGAHFTVVNRRHHCRHCGRVVCGKCSACSFLLDSCPLVVRVCNACFDRLVEDHGGWAAVSPRTELYRAPRQALYSCRTFTPPVLWLKQHVSGWLEDVCGGVYAGLAALPDVPANGQALLDLTGSAADALFAQCPELDGNAERTTLLAQFMEHIGQLRMVQQQQQQQQQLQQQQAQEQEELSRSSRLRNTLRSFRGSSPPPQRSPQLPEQTASLSSCSSPQHQRSRSAANAAETLPNVPTRRPPPVRQRTTQQTLRPTTAPPARPPRPPPPQRPPPQAPTAATAKTTGAATTTSAADSAESKSKC